MYLQYGRLDINALWFKLVASMPLSFEPTWLMGLVSLGDSTIPRSTSLFSKSSSMLIYYSCIISILIPCLDTDYLDPSRYSSKPTSLLSPSKAVLNLPTNMTYSHDFTFTLPQASVRYYSMKQSTRWCISLVCNTLLESGGDIQISVCN